MPRKRSSEPTDRAVDHHRLLLLRILVDIEGAEAFRQVEVDLRRAALPVAADGVAQRVFELRPVEGALALVDADLDASAGFGRHLVEHLLQDILGVIPHRIVPTRFSGRVASLTTTSSKPKSS
jgi:hypothetical protein